MDKEIPEESSRAYTSTDFNALTHLEAVIDNAPGVVFSIDKSFRLITLNTVLVALVKQCFGIELKQGDSLIKFFEQISPETSEEWRKIYERAFTGENLRFVKEFNFEKKYFGEFFINPVRQKGEIKELACFVRNITEQKLSEAKLKESEERYRLVAENPILGIVWGTIDGIIFNANKTYCDIMECTLDEIKGVHFSEFTHPDDYKVELPLFERLVKGEIRNYRLEKRYITKKKNIKWVEVNITAVKDKEGRFNDGIGIVQDITAKQETEELLHKSETNMRYVLDNTITASVLLDKELSILTANRLANDWAMLEMGITLQEGEKFLNHFPGTYKVAGESILVEVLQGSTHSYEAKYTTRDNVTRWYFVNITPIADKNNNIMGLCITSNDTTRHRDAEAQIKLLNDSLEKKVKERTAELEEANKELEAFTYSVSHDLLTPLRNIDSFIDVLMEDHRNVLNEEGQQTLAVVKRNSVLMARLIEDLLNFARFGKVPLVKQLVNMDGIVSEVIDELRFTTNNLAAKIKTLDMNPAYCDPQLIKQVWVNLISNAIKYTSKKKTPEIVIGSQEQDNHIVYFIKDNGVGFDVKDADKLFGVFHRLHKSTEFEGTGVGLAIVHRIITKHGGKIWAEGKAGEGAVFYFTV